MASLANHVQKIIRHRIPLIRFKYGANQSSTESHPSGHSQNDMKFSQTNGASSESQHGQKSAPLESSQTPNKYRRRPLTQEEIELVKVGGFA